MKRTLKLKLASRCIAIGTHAPVIRSSQTRRRVALWKSLQLGITDFKHLCLQSQTKATKRSKIMRKVSLILLGIAGVLVLMTGNLIFSVKASKPTVGLGRQVKIAGDVWQAVDEKSIAKGLERP